MARERNILVVYHCRSNTGYAIASLEGVFARAARSVAGESGQVSYAYGALDGGRPTYVSESDDVLELPYHTIDARTVQALRAWLRAHSIDVVLAFDMPLRAQLLEIIREESHARVVSYWGASISDVFPWYLRPLRRVQYLLARSRPNHFIFESEGMRKRATHGAGVPRSATSVLRLGVDTDRFKPDAEETGYIYDEFSIPRDRRIVFFSGHMEERKGVHVLIDAFAKVMLERAIRDVHLVLLGDTPDDRVRLLQRVPGQIRGHVSFGGYRTDIARLHRGVSIGVIASTGWDSFTMSAVEMAASGIPLIVSDLDGLQEAVIPEQTGLRVARNDPQALSVALVRLLRDDRLRVSMGIAARERAVRELSVERQISALVGILSAQIGRLA